MRATIPPIGDPRENRLLAALPPEDLRRIAPELNPVHLPLGQVIHESGVGLAHAYFPTSSIVSLLYVLANGSSAEIAIVGNDGVVGVAVFMGGDSTLNRAVVQNHGWAYRVPSSVLVDEFTRGGELQHLLPRDTHSLLSQMAQTAVCNRHHSIDEQLCRWLLLSLDRLPTPEIFMTQELIANMLGVRREGVTTAAGKLQSVGLIRYLRGRITVLDRAGIEARCCECYAVVKREADRLMPPSTARRQAQPS